VKARTYAVRGKRVTAKVDDDGADGFAVSVAINGGPFRRVCNCSTEGAAWANVATELRRLERDR
jgi:hypothetical protein